MLRKGFLILLLFFFSLHARAQLSYAEFFFDSDPGVGNGLVLNFNPADSLNQTFSFSTIGLQPGPHQVFWRFRNAQGVWGLTQHQSFFLQSDLSAAEYFFDHDPGHGNATPLNVSLSVDSIQSVLSFISAGLSPGPHRVFWRFRNAQGVWGLTQSQTFILQDGLQTAEYFFNHDPGPGNGFSFNTSLPADSVQSIFSLNTNALNPGDHRLFWRFRNAEGQWSHAHSANIRINTSINHAEYFIDHDPGPGNGIAFSPGTPADSIQQIFSFATNNTTPGEHRLYWRFRNTAGAWSHTHSVRFVNENPLLKAEYFFGADPGQGNATPFTQNFSADSLNQIFQFNLLGLPPGDTTLNWRFLSASGQWSHVQFDTLSICQTPDVPLLQASDTLLCPNESAQLSASAPQAQSWIWYADSIQILNANASVFIADSAASYFAAYSDSFGCGNISQPITLLDAAWPDIPSNIFAHPNLSICSGNHANIWLDTANVSEPLQYAWFGPSGLIPNAPHAILSVSAPGNYFAQITNAAACSIFSDTVQINVIPPPLAAGGLSNNTITSGNPPFTVNVQNLNPQTGIQYTWFFGDGTAQTTNASNFTHAYYNNGIYYISLIAFDPQTGCSDTLFDTANPDLVVTINSSSANTCGNLPQIQPSGVVQVCIGGQITLDAGPVSGNFLWQWNRNGIPIGGATLPQLTVNTSGYYTITRTDSNCQLISQPVQVIFNLPAQAPPLITPSGAFGACGTGQVILQASGNYSSWLWSNGSSNPSITVNTPGYYTLIGQGQAGCDGQTTILIKGDSLPAPEICVADVSLQNNDVLQWSWPADPLLAGVNVMAESQTGLVFNAGFVPVSAAPQFVSPVFANGTPATRFFLVPIDTCGGAGIPSALSKPMHLQVAPGTGTQRILSWNQVQWPSQNISWYLIYEGSSPTSLSLSDSVPASQNFYVDANPLAGLNTWYRVGQRLSQECNNQSIAYSNLAGQSWTPFPEGLDEKPVSDWALMPNPGKDHFYLRSNFPEPIEELSLSDALGKIIDSKTSIPAQINHHLYYPHLAPGSYFLRIRTSTQTKTLILLVAFP